jgi:hypothetical protein
MPIKHDIMNKYGVIEVELHAFLAPAEYNGVAYYKTFKF